LVKGSTTQVEKCALLREYGIQPFRIRATEHLQGENIDEFFQSDLLILNIPPGRKRADVLSYHVQQIKNILERALANGLKKLIFISSTSVYGNVNETVSEADLPQPSRPSGMALLKIEHWLKEQAIELSILRMAGLAGGNRKAGRFLAGKKDLANGDAPVNMIHRADAISIILQVILQKKWRETFNCCADKHPSRKAFYTAQAKKQGFEAPSFLDGSPTEFKIISNRKVKEVLDYSFLHPDPMAF